MIVVGIGGSAGGQEAISELLKHLPNDTGMAFVYIQHLSPEHESSLSSILGRITTMTVSEVEDNVKMEGNHLYIIPPNYDMTMANGNFTLHTRANYSDHSNNTINKFFNSLADHYQEHAIGVILSGAANDGSVGLKAIKIAGGITFAQDESAKFQSMPKSAIADGAVDLVLSPKEIAEELVRIAKQKEAFYTAMNDVEESVGSVDEDLISILSFLNRNVGVDFRQYKLTTIRRRVIRRMLLHKYESLKDYLTLLKQNQQEVHLLYQDLLINVTTFFRDGAMCDYLLNTLFPAVVKSKLQNEPIRIWVPACSTGQEVYSLAIILFEILGSKAPSTPIQIFATDLSEASINKARLGMYSIAEVADISPTRLETYFTRIDGHYRIVKSIRDVCIFATHNLAKDPPFSRLDVISCCNVLIYLDVALQRKVFNTFHYSLNENGFLVLGKSEAIGGSNHLFSLVEKKLKVYVKKKDAVAKAVFELNYRLPNGVRSKQTLTKTPADHRRDSEVAMELIVDKLLLKKYTPASVVINNELDIIQFRGPIGMFLEPAPGKASLNLIKMARAGLGFELRNLVHKAKKTGEVAKKEGLEILNEGKVLPITLQAVPLKGNEIEDEYYLVVFEEKLVSLLDQTVSSASDKRVKQLEAELTALREDIRSIIESQEASNEELQSANEEIVSSNEELQSINEELETSKEEIESSNEELLTINQELQERNEQLSEMQEYAEAVFSTMRESLLILKKDLRVKNANAAFYKTFKVTESETIGKWLYDLGDNHWNIPALRHLLEEVIPQNSLVENFEVTHIFPALGEKMMVLNACKITQSVHGEHLILLAIEDVTPYAKSSNKNAE